MSILYYITFILYYIVLYYIILYCIVLYYIVLHCIVLYLLYYIILHYITLYYIILYYIILYYIKRGKPRTCICSDHTCRHPQGGVIKRIYYKNFQNQCTNMISEFYILYLISYISKFNISHLCIGLGSFDNTSFL